jgi:hypothetical protein
MNMKTRFATSNQDTFATTTLLAAAIFAVAGGAFANSVSAKAAPMEIQRLEAVVVTAKRMADVKLDTIVVTAPRLIRHS